MREGRVPPRASRARGAVSVSAGLALLAGAALAPAAGAHDAEPTYDRASLSVGASDEVDNDLLVAVVASQREGPDQAALADTVNRAVAWAIERANATPGVSVQTLGYDTRPVYAEQQLTGWRVRQGVRLESRDASAIAGLVGELQERLAVESIDYDLSPERRREAEDALITEAITAFRERARLVTRELGREEYRVVHLDVSSSRSSPPPRQARGAVMAMESSVAAPALEAGAQQVTVQVSGTIELQPTP